jgi:phospholipase/carboxylesterase
MNAELRQLNGWVLRQRVPEGPGPHPLMLLLHGWTGDENAMWVFANRLPKDALLVAPRGLYPTTLGGYGWQPSLGRAWPDLEDFRPAMEALGDLLSPQNFPAADGKPIRLAGFSQGAALGYSLALAYPHRVDALAGLSGFAPGGVEQLVKTQPLAGKACYMAHGTQDELVPVARARQARQLLLEAGAQVTYCEDDVGHKLSASCFRGMGKFFENSGYRSE